MERAGFRPQQDTESAQKQNAISKVADLYFQPKPWESEGLYEAVGIRHFQRLLKLLPIYRMSRRDSSKIKDQLNLGKFAESVHAPIFGAIASLEAYQFKSGEWEWAVPFVALNVATQLYPVMSQRYNRIRLNRIKKKMEEQSTSK